MVEGGDPIRPWTGLFQAGSVQSRCLNPSWVVQPGSFQDTPPTAPAKVAEACKECKWNRKGSSCTQPLTLSRALTSHSSWGSQPWPQR